MHILRELSDSNKKTIEITNDLFAVLTCMDVSMLLHVRLLMEAFSTVLARVGSGIAVNQHVRVKGR